VTGWDDNAYEDFAMVNIFVGLSFPLSSASATKLALARSFSASRPTSDSDSSSCFSNWLQRF